MEWACFVGSIFFLVLYSNSTQSHRHTPAHTHTLLLLLYISADTLIVSIWNSPAQNSTSQSYLAFLQNAIRGLLSVKTVFNLLTSCPAHHCPLPVSLRLQYYVCGPPLLWRAGACLSLPSLPAQEVLAFPGTTILPKRAFALGSLFPLKALTINIILNYLDLIYWESILNLKN